MRQLFFIGFVFLMPIKTYGQINMNDSTVQVIGYWDKNEKQTYIVTNQSYKVKNSDTSSRESYKYAVDMAPVFGFLPPFLNPFRPLIIHNICITQATYIHKCQSCKAAE